MKYEIWIGNHYSRFDHGFLHTKAGSCLPLKAWIHTATYGPDSVLIADPERYEYEDFPVRWFTTFAGIEFYCWDPEVKSIILHNDSGSEIIVKGYGVLPAGQSHEYIKEG